MVKFGKQIEEDSALLTAAVELRQPFHYNEFKKILVCCKEVSPTTLSNARQAQEAAERYLQEPFWLWPQDAEHVDGKVDGEFEGNVWFQQLFERKLLSEARRIKNARLSVQKRIDALKSSLSTLRSKDHVDDAQGYVKAMIELRCQIDTLDQQLDSYTTLNYVAFYKIIKKFGKADDVFTETSLLARLMPVLDNILFGSSRAGSKVLIRLASKSKQDEGPPKSRQNYLRMLDSIYDDMNASLSPNAKKSMSVLKMTQHLQCEELLDLDDDKAEDDSEVPSQEEDSKASFSIRSFLPPVLRVLLSEYSMQAFSQDMVSALVIAVAGIPKAMSYAELAGLPVSAGIATLYIPCIVYALLGGSRQIALSPQSVTCLLLAQMVNDALAGSEMRDDMSERMKVTMLFTLCTGIAMVAFGALNLAFLLSFISKPVLSGFVSASAIIAAGSTVKSLLGISVKKSPFAHVLVSRVVERLPDIHWATAALSASGILIMAVVPPLQKLIAHRLEHRKSRLALVARFMVRIPVVLLVVILGILVGGGLCNFEAFTLWEPEHVVVGSGATSVHELHQSVRVGFDCDSYDDRVIVEYAATGSGEGITSVLSDTPVVDFAYSDKMPSHADLAKYSVDKFPVASSIVCPVANVPLVHGSHQINLVLDLPTVTDIFSGKIQSWSDARIEQLNPNLPWQTIDPATPIHVVVRSDPSGTSETFSAALANCDACNSSSLSSGLTVKWEAPLQVEARSNRDAVRLVANTPWSIGYATLGEVKRLQSAEPGLSFHCVALRNGSKIVTTDMSWSQKASWPVMQTTHVLVPRASASPLGVARHRDTCLARRLLMNYLDEVYADPAASKALYLTPASRPKALDDILCTSGRTRTTGNADDDALRRLSAPRRRLAGKCKASTPACSEIKMVGYIESSLLKPEQPRPATGISFGTLVTNALLLASVTLLEHVANAKLYADRNDYELNLSADIVAAGLSNVVGALFGSFIVAGGFSRSALNAKAASQVSGLAAVVMSFFIVWLASSQLSMLPVAVLNVVLFVAVIALFDWKLIVALARMRRRGAGDLLQLIIAFVSTCTLGVVHGMIIAIGFSLVLFIFHSAYPQIVELRRIRGTMNYDIACAVDQVPARGSRVCKTGSDHSKHVCVVRFEAPMWFANVPRFSDHLLETLKRGRGRIHGVVCDMSSVPRMDTTAGMTFAKLLIRSKELGASIAFANATGEVQAMLYATCGLKCDSFHTSIYEAEAFLESEHQKACQPESDASIDKWTWDRRAIPHELPRQESKPTVVESV
eukprot:TRINITY_DN17628_c0_g1_i1.p1 TRINITY_DN17628_c0_g1~~TRINITY_DN17628_c0_g1_i1.p1  ORF type:complete len:1283 (+),score=142.92 TRINITY_DN17628_c0_g1_i1:40-3888(+)